MLARASSRLLLGLLLLPAGAVQTAGPVGEPPSEVRLAEGTRWATSAWVRRSDRPGPAVLIVGGMHGSEAAGWRAARQLRHWPIARGELIVLPRANARGCEAFERRVPDEKPYDLNRSFPSGEDESMGGPLAGSIWALADRIRPDWVVDLHESVGYRFESTDERKLLGNSLICYPGEETGAAAARMAEALDELVREEDHRWRLLRWPIEGSLTRAAGSRLGAHALIVETCRKDHLAVRILQHRVAVHRLLVELDMLPEGFSPATVFGEERGSQEIRTAIYDDRGTGSRSAFDLERCLDPAQRAGARRITAEEIRSGALDAFDVVMFPGGTGSGTARALEEEGRAAVREFVEEGGGLLGVCAGAYLATSHYSWSLGVLDARVVDTEHWARGKGTVRMELSPAGRELFGAESPMVSVRYAQGPLLAPGGDPDVPDFQVLSSYRSEIAENGAPEGVMIDTPAIVRGRFGEGRVLVSSPHPESSAELRPYVRAALRWLAGAGP